MTAPAAASSSSPSRRRPRQDLSKTEAAVCGAIAGGASRVLTAPFDVVKIRFQLQVGSIATAADRQRLAYQTVAGSLRKVAREEGLIGLWRGNLAATYLWIGYGAVQFPVYEALKPELACMPSLAPVAAFVAGGGAGLAATVATYPFDVIRTQFAAQGLPRAHETMASFVRATLRTQGWKGLFAGLTPTALQIIPRMGLSFALYEKMDAAAATAAANTQSDEKEGGSGVLWGEEVRQWCLSAVYGGVSGGIARAAVHPLDTLKRRMQAQVLFVLSSDAPTTILNSSTKPPTRRFHSSWDCLLHIVRHEGVTALYKGLAPTLLKSVLSTAIIFAVYEGLKTRLLHAAAAREENRK
jgi:solute carrier family 25 thiamine pyrophosphate transporter 19